MITISNEIALVEATTNPTVSWLPRTPLLVHVSRWELCWFPTVMSSCYNVQCRSQSALRPRLCQLLSKWINGKDQLTACKHIVLYGDDVSAFIFTLNSLTWQWLKQIQREVQVKESELNIQSLQLDIAIKYSHPLSVRKSHCHFCPLNTLAIQYPSTSHTLYDQLEATLGSHTVM